jgi:hypothetical protein
LEEEKRILGVDVVAKKKKGMHLKVFASLINFQLRRTIMKLEDILKFIRDSQNRDTLPLIESVISETKKKQFNIGSKVIFGRANGKQHFGTIEKINITKAVVRSDGAKWTVPFNLMQLSQKGFSD